jgi:ElaB/YqjD/DUF883 family membrane-anchored ribosome-binding protein
MKTSHNRSHGETAETEEASEHLLEDAQALLSATAHVAEEKVMDARKRLMAAVDKGRESLIAVREKAVAGAKATDRMVRTHPYQAVGIALGIGVLVGFLWGRRNRE